MNTQITLARACACLLLATAGAHAHAQQTSAAAANPQAAVPATRYQSALGKQPEAAPTSSPDQNWVAGNETVAATNSMSLTMKMRGQASDPHAGHAMPGMVMDKKDSPAMCAPGGGAAAGDGKGMQCMSGGEAGKGKMACCENGCSSCCCKDMMMKKKETS
jgi:hypothetical protein